MEVRFRRAYALNAILAVYSIVTISCSQQKSVQSVFNDSNPQSKSKCSGSAIPNQFIVNWEDGRITVEKSQDKDIFIKEFLEPQLSQIKRVEFDREYQFHTNEISTNSTTQAPQNWGQHMVQADQLWANGIYGKGITIAVVDSYVDVKHPLIKDNIQINEKEVPNNGIDDDENGVVDDYYGASFVTTPTTPTTHSEHGTHVSGIIAAQHNSQFQFGMAPQAKIVPIQFIDDTGGGSIGSAILAIQYATARKVNIINASWGGGPCVDSLKDAMTAASDAGTLIVVAAGNEYQDIDYYPVFPAAFNLSNQITVAASGIRDLMMAFSNSGFHLVQLASPGEDIFSTTPSGYAYMSGTSMAAPMVAGAAALLWSAKPTATASQIKSALLSGVDVAPGYEFQVQTRGRLNVNKALLNIH